MKKTIEILVLLLIAFVNFSATLEQTFDITVKFSNLRNSKGKVNVQLFKSKESFSDEKCWKEWYFVKGSNVKDGTMTVTVPNIPAGTYGIAILDDENENKEMDYKMMIPKEGFGFSNYYHTAWSKPKYDNFKFELNKDLTVNIKVRYV